MVKYNAPKSHPKYLSNLYRDKLVFGIKQKMTSLQGLIAHGRGEMFDYLIGEETLPFAHKAISVAAAVLLTAKYPVLSVNGNTAILVPKELIKLSDLLGAGLEVNLFHPPKNREKRIALFLKKLGAEKIILPDNNKIPDIESRRRFISSQGQMIADVVFVPLEDGDRTEALVKMRKKVITVDLNPLSRTAQKATVTIVDNIVRTMPQLIKAVKEIRSHPKRELIGLIKTYDNGAVLSEALLFMSKRLALLAKK